MLATWWLAVAGLPVFIQPLPEAPDRPAAVAVVPTVSTESFRSTRIAPADPRTTDPLPAPENAPAWLGDLHAMIRAAVADLPVPTQ